MARRFQNRQFQSRSKPNRAWFSFFLAEHVDVPAGSKVLLGTLALSNTNIDETVLRTVGSFSIASDQAAVSERQLGAFGIIRVSEAAAAIGITAVPGPVTDAGDDGWFMYMPFQQANIVLTAAGFDSDAALRYPFDSKAKRVTEEGVVLAVVVENAHASNALRIAIGFRLLSQITGTG